MKRTTLQTVPPGNSGTQPRKPERKRQLNVIYFIDSERTRSFRLSINAFYAVLALVGSVALWAVVSVAILASNSRLSSYQSLRIRTLLTAIFEHQTQYDQVYEKAYPVDKGQDRDPAAIVSHEKANDETLDALPADEEEVAISKPKQRSSPPAVTLAAKIIEPLPAETSQELGAASDREKTAASTAEQTPLPRIVDTKLSAAGEDLGVKFAIRNAPGIERSQGFLWGVATYETASGEKIFVPAPRDLPIDGAGKPLNMDKVFRFNIRFYKAKSLVFNRPAQKVGTFRMVQIFLHNSEGGQAVETVSISQAEAGQKSKGDAQGSTKELPSTEQPEETESEGFGTDEHETE
jgi:hypothetical protein